MKGSISSVAPLTSNKQNNFSLRFAETLILDPETNKNVTFKSLWEDATEDIIVIHFFRRFG